MLLICQRRFVFRLSFRPAVLRPALLAFVTPPARSLVRRPEIHRIAAVIEQHVHRVLATGTLFQPVGYGGDRLRREHDAGAVRPAAVEQALLAVLRPGREEPMRLIDHVEERAHLVLALEREGEELGLEAAAHHVGKPVQGQPP